jgi:tRNA G46 methylase TrmB
MPFVNPYKEKVKNNVKILIDTEKIYAIKGKWNNFFDNKKAIILEIGTGMGNTFSREVSKDKNSNFIGMELRYKRLERTVEKTLAVG